MFTASEAVFLNSVKTKDVIIGLVIAIALVSLSFLASTSPDGLERVAHDKNFMGKAVNSVKTSPPALLGVITVFILVIILANLLRKKR